MAARKTTGLLVVSAFTVGMGVMAVEITASRLLAPYFGASLFVWTSLIVTVLLAMSFGYWVGGAAAERGKGIPTLGFLLCGASFVLLAGIFIIGDLSKALTGVFMAWTNASATLFLASLAASFLVFALPVFLLAAASPVILKEWTRTGGDVGRVAGRYFAVSTIGSVVGTIAPTLVLVPAVGAKATVEIFAVIFLLLGASLLAWKERKFLAVIAMPLMTVSYLTAPAAPADIIDERESPYQLIRVTAPSRASSPGGEDDGTRHLLFNEGAGIQSIYRPDARRIQRFYFDYAGVIPLIRPYEPETHHALIIGFAGGSAARAYSNYLPDGRRARITGVEVDPAVVAVAREHFNIDEIGAEVIVMDGRMFLQTTPDRYDTILVDAYSSQVYIPPHMATTEFYRLAKSRLKPGGVVVMNINAPTDESRLLKALINSAAPHFRHMTVVPTPASWNRLVFASDEPIDMAAVAAKIPQMDDDIIAALARNYAVSYRPDEEVFTDDRAPIEMLTDTMVLDAVFASR
jgi:MFS family permease